MAVEREKRTPYLLETSILILGLIFGSSLFYVGKSNSSLLAMR